MVLSLEGITFCLKFFLHSSVAEWGNDIEHVTIEHEDRQALSMNELDLNRVIFATCLKEDETKITGVEKYLRLVSLEKPLAGGRQLLALWLDYQANGERSVLELIRQERGIIQLDFFGIVFCHPCGNFYVPCLLYDGRWMKGVTWLGNPCKDKDFALVFDI